jgi:A/G-specific adenine glycosylase
VRAGRGVAPAFKLQVAITDKRSSTSRDDGAAELPEAVTDAFAARVVDWQQQHGRNDLPWQRNRDPYAVWVSEIMLQQTQVATVIPYYERFMECFPDVTALAGASLDEVMRCWSGLGYYSRARNLHRAASVVITNYGGLFPRDANALAELPGIGRSTAAAIAALAYGQRCAILDGNVKRVLCRYFAIDGDPASSLVERRLWALAEGLAPAKDIARYTQGMMDIGATVCTRHRPRCDVCVLARDCVARSTDRVEELPQVRKRKPVPERSVAMLLLQHAGQVLLEKRPQTGIWGGLWSLPEAAPEEDVEAVCLRRFGARGIEVAALPELVHGFTHFRLRIKPWRILVGSLQVGSGEPGLVWLSLEEARSAALPVPVRKILEVR